VIGTLQALDPHRLSPETRIDRQMLIWSLQDDELVTGELSNWRHNPDIYTQTASGAIYAVLANNYAPLARRMRSVIARELEIPRLLQQGEQNVTAVDAATAAVAHDDTAGAIAFFTNDVPAAVAGVADSDLRRQFAAANAGAIKAVAAYAQWIDANPLAHPVGTFAIGTDAYQRRLLYEDGLTMPIAEYLAVGERALAQTQAQFSATAAKIDPNRPPADVYASLATQHASAETMISAAQATIARLRSFVVLHHIITLPADANIRAVETPAFQRSQLFAAFTGPGPLERVATQSYYYITPPGADLAPEQRDHLLGFLNDFALPIISAHEVMPGHFVNAMIDKHLRLSLTRKLLWSSEFGEGWAHYDEQMIVDQGWGGGDPRVRLAQLGAALVREGRFIVGVKEHTQGMSVDEAAKFLVDDAYMSNESAHREALRGTQDPMYGYYTLGKLMILKLRADYQRKAGSAYSLQRFHDALLAHGDPPIPLLRPLLLGTADDGKPL
jgi:uncharacterized protein (DUF885 family)